jgi:hypothetical protein
VALIQDSKSWMLAKKSIGLHRSVLYATFAPSQKEVDSESRATSLPTSRFAAASFLFSALITTT